MSVDDTLPLFSYMSLLRQLVSAEIRFGYVCWPLKWILQYVVLHIIYIYSA